MVTNLSAMKRIIHLFPAFTLLVLVISGCVNDTVSENGDDEPPSTAPPPVQCLDIEPTEDWPDRLKGRLAFEHTLKDIWGYRDPDSGREYALMGFTPDHGQAEDLHDSTGVYIVDVTDPSDPGLAGTATRAGGFDIKTWKHYMYSVSGSDEVPGTIVDISDPSNPSHVGEFPGSHNLYITDDGLMVLSTHGTAIYDLRNDPTDPELLWSESGNGHESAVADGILYDFQGFDGTKLFNLDDPENPELLSTIAPGSDTVRYHHSGWTTSDRNTLIITDERPGGSAGEGPDYTVWDISDKSSPRFLTSYRDANSTVHNVHIIGNQAHFAYYASGYRIFDIGDPASPSLIFEFDTAPQYSEQGNFAGAWGVYGLAPSGNVYISDTDCGLFVF